MEQKALEALRRYMGTDIPELTRVQVTPQEIAGWMEKFANEVCGEYQHLKFRMEGLEK